MCLSYYTDNRRICDVAYRAKLFYEARARREAAEKDITKNKQYFNTTKGLQAKLETRLKEMIDTERNLFDSYANKAQLQEDILTKAYGTRSAADRAILEDFERATHVRLTEHANVSITKHVEEFEHLLERKNDHVFATRMKKFEAEMEQKYEKLLEAKFARLEAEYTTKLNTAVEQMKQSIQPVDHSADIENMRQFALGMHGKVNEIEQNLVTQSQQMVELRQMLNKHDSALRSLRDHLETQQDWQDSMIKTMDIRLNGKLTSDVDEETPVFTLNVGGSNQQTENTSDTKSLDELKEQVRSSTQLLQNLGAAFEEHLSSARSHLDAHYSAQKQLTILNAQFNAHIQEWQHFRPGLNRLLAPPQQQQYHQQHRIA